MRRASSCPGARTTRSSDYFMRPRSLRRSTCEPILDVLEGRRLDDGVGDRAAVNLPKGQIGRRSSCSSSTARSRATGVATCARRTHGSRTRSGSSGARGSCGWSSGRCRHYMRHDGCYMEFLARLLDDPAAAPCGRCSNDTGGRGLPARWTGIGPRGSLVRQARPADDQTALRMAGRRGTGPGPARSTPLNEIGSPRACTATSGGQGRQRASMWTGGSLWNSCSPRPVRSAIVGGPTARAEVDHGMSSTVSVASSTGSPDRRPPNLPYPTSSACRARRRATPEGHAEQRPAALRNARRQDSGSTATNPGHRAGPPRR